MSGTKHTKGKRHGKVHHLPDEIREQVDRLVIEPDVTLDDIALFLREKGYDISRSSIGRYSKEYFETYQRLRVMEDQAKALVGDPEQGLVLEEAAAKLFNQRVLELLMEGGVDLKAIPRILGDFARLQMSSVAREKWKSELRKKIAKTAEKVEKLTKSAGLTPATAARIRKEILGIGT